MAYDLAARKTFKRPQAAIFSDRKFSFNSATDEYLPPVDLNEGLMEAIILPDHGRKPIQLGFDRIESRTRMINGTSRSFWTADKLNFSTSWDGLPSRLAENGQEYVDGMQMPIGRMFLADNAAPAWLLRDWYNGHPEPFYVYMSFDDGIINGRLGQRYVEERRMFFTNFSMVLGRRGLYDFWDIDLALEEV